MGTAVKKTAGVECEWAVLCDYAIRAQDGKVSAVGIFDDLLAPTLPITHPQLALVIRLRGPQNETVQMRIEVTHPLRKEPLHWLGGPMPMGPAGVNYLTLQLVGLPIPEAGRYSFRILADGQLLKTVSLRVHRVDPGAPPPPSPTAGTIH